MTSIAETAPASGVDSSYAWCRLAASLALGTVGGVGMWSAIVILPAVQAEFGVGRGTASLPITLLMLGFGFGGMVLGRMADRFRIIPVVLTGIAALGLGYVGAGLAQSFWQFALIHGLLLGMFGCAADSVGKGAASRTASGFFKPISTSNSESSD